MKTIYVVAAIIINDGKVFATQRGYGEFQGGWEFPGGKVENGEIAQEALRREIREELDTDIQVLDLLDTIEYDYPQFHIRLECHICDISSGNLMLREHEDSCWLDESTLYDVAWLPADYLILKKLENYLKHRKDN